MPDAIRMHNLLFGYEPGAPLLQIEEFRVQEGARIFVYGPSGSGKTTFLGLITGILKPQQGSCEVLGREMTEMSLSARDELRGSEMGYIFQSFNLISYLSVRENIDLPCRIHRERRARILAPSLREEAERIAEHLDLSAQLDQSVKKLSTGQQQRVAIARAIMGQPRLVIADEPTSSLDSDRRERFLDLLFKVCSGAQATLVFVSHDQSLRPRFDTSISIAELATPGRSEVQA